MFAVRDPSDPKEVSLGQRAGMPPERKNAAAGIITSLLVAPERREPARRTRNAHA